jgi:hypothetical protein
MLVKTIKKEELIIENIIITFMSKSYKELSPFLFILLSSFSFYKYL